MACKNFFSFNFPLREFFFVLRPPPPPPHKFSNGPSLKGSYWLNDEASIDGMTSGEPDVRCALTSGI